MKPEAPLLDLDQFLPYRLSRLSNRISQAIADAYVDRFNLGVTEWRVMAVLGRFPGLSAGEVAERTAMDKVAVSRAVARLIESGRVLRGTADGDRRRSVLRLSAAGRRTYQDVVPRVVAIEQQLLGQLDPAARTQLAALLDRLERSFATSPAPEPVEPLRP
jgi:DNA-binding MarR family transcriptional regulator